LSAATIARPVPVFPEVGSTIVLPLALRRLHHRDRDPVLDRAARVEVLELRDHRRGPGRDHPLEPDEWRVADELRQRRVLPRHARQI
jgi:hypothetical protein